MESRARFCHECGVLLDVSPGHPASAPADAGANPQRSQVEYPPHNPSAKKRITGADPLANSMDSTLSGVGKDSMAERRQLSVLFCDLVSFTTLSQQLDAEDLSNTVHEYYGVCRAVCQRYEGHIANYLGDGVLMMFGYPSAHEDDAHRAVRTGLAVIEAMAALSDRLENEIGQRLQVRVGIHTGLMIVGDDRAGNWEQMASGDTLNIAARLQRVADAGTVAISGVTHEMVAGFFSCQSIGIHQLKGILKPLEVFTVLAESTARGRLEAAGRASLTPLTGRDAEAAQLRQQWERAATGRGHALLIRAEGGMGKSRLVQTLKEHVSNQPNAWLTPCQCSPYHQNTSMYPFIDLIERVVLKLDRNHSPRERLNKLEGMILQYGFDPQEFLPVFAAFHSVPPACGYEPSTLDPTGQRRQYMYAMRQILIERSLKQPLLFIVEDLHWVDPTTLETLNELLKSLEGHKILAIFTARPEFNSPWDDTTNVFTIDLPKLEGPQISTICHRVARDKDLPNEVLTQIVKRANGVALFAEELTKMVIGSGLIRADGGKYRLTGPLPDLAIPTTLQGSLTARLDRLSKTKEIAQIAAVIGGHFNYELLRHIYPIEDSLLRQGLRELMDEEIIDQFGGADDSEYQFKHILVQEAAYQSLVKGRRQQYHRLIAQALEEHFAEIINTEPEVLAHHYTSANLSWQAIPYLQKAGAKASARSSHNEAIGHYTKALSQLRRLSDSDQRGQLEIQILIGLGASLTALRGYGADEVKQTYSHARDLCEQFGTPGQLFQARYGLWRLHMLRGQYDIATREGNDLLEMATRQGSEAFLIASHRALGSTQFYRGQFKASVEHTLWVINTTASLSDDDTLIRDIYDVVDPRVTCHSYLSWNLWMLGRREQAIVESNRAIDLAERLKHPFSLALAVSFAIWLQQFCGRMDRVQELCERSIDHCQQHGFTFWFGWNQVLLGWARSHQEQTSTACIEVMRKGIADWKESGSDLGRSYFLCLIADVHLRFCEWSAAMDVLAEAQTFMHDTGEHFYQAECHRLQREVMAKLHPGSSSH